MNKPKDDTVYLRHVLDAIARIEQYLAGVDETTFSQQSLIQDGVIRQLQIVGETVRQLSPEIRDRYPEVPWQKAADMRSKLVHDYLGIELPTVWDTVTKDLPLFKQNTQKILTKITSSA